MDTDVKHLVISCNMYKIGETVHPNFTYAFYIKVYTKSWTTFVHLRDFNLVKMYIFTRQRSCSSIPAKRFYVKLFYASSIYYPMTRVTPLRNNLAHMSYLQRLNFNLIFRYYPQSRNEQCNEIKKTPFLLERYLRERIWTPIEIYD